MMRSIKWILQKLFLPVLKLLNGIPGLPYLGRSLGPLVRREFESDAGVINLVFGIILGIFTILVVVTDVFTKIISRFFGFKEVPIYYPILALLSMAFYFAWCVKVISSAEVEKTKQP